MVMPESRFTSPRPLGMFCVHLGASPQTITSRLGGVETAGGRGSNMNME